MNLWVCLLRGINVGSDRKLPMADLKAVLAKLGAEEIETYIQSGNAVFTGDIDPERFAGDLAQAIAGTKGFRPEVLLLPGAEMLRADAAYPFAPDAPGEKPAHVWFCARAPEAPDLSRLEAVALPSERFVLDGRLFFLRAPEGVGRSKLAAKVERVLGVPTTARNLKTVATMAEMIRARA
ncbi:DUF1697 domain-containing protein [uncultured Maritimibacter sp.]|uniref:DUF1697 domain-containing protein n=1 Tax=uncultured Maritimibacter sp. TaxID=991866 RepID=UPI0026383D12|nr:DUF1697 domain-containing protein [uncultured Maritimibacter sp.]